jgi:hypothetical protein
MWTSNKMIALYIVLGLVIAGVVTWLIARKAVRTRLGVEKALRDDPDINDFLVIFGWTPKVLYVPTILVSLVASALMFLQETEWGVFAGINPRLVGSIWFCVFFVNFLIEEYDINIKIILIAIVGVGFLFLWLHLLGWVGSFLRSFRHMGFTISGTGYLLLALIGAITIFISWFRGLFYYVAITPNYMNLQEGPAESGEQIGREDYNTRIDTSDFLERLLGFGRFIITFKEKSRTPMTLLVWNVEKKAQLLEKVRAKLAMDHPVSPPASPPPSPTP